MRIDFITLGCSKNLVDSEFLSKQLEHQGYEVYHDATRPCGKIIIINTCGFIGDAKEESINTILFFAKRKREKKIDQLFVMGCFSQRYMNELKAEIPEVDKFYGKFDFNNLLKDLGKKYIPDLRLERAVTTKHYAYVKIAEGCNRTCSYCAIPIITGKHKSRTMEDIISEVEQLTEKGVKEIQLIAQDLSFYGYDLYHQSKLAELIKRISDIKGVEWLRLHYTYPTQFPFDILPVMRERANICNYLDIALQHISNHILKLMRRNITAEETRQLLLRIREEVPDIHLRTTLLVGHPDETEDDFNELLDFVKEYQFERMGAFTYSHEEGTFAYKHYIDNIPFETKEIRLNKLMAEQQIISNRLNNNKIGKTFKVIIDRKSDEFYIGRTEYDSPEVDCEVLIKKGNKHLSIGNFYNIKITDAMDFDLYGELI